MVEKRKLSAREFVADMKAGMTDSELMVKHQLSPKDLENVYQKLIDAKIITVLDLSSRSDAKSKSAEETPKSVRKLVKYATGSDLVKKVGKVLDEQTVTRSASESVEKMASAVKKNPHIQKIASSEAVKKVTETVAPQVQKVKSSLLERYRALSPRNKKLLWLGVSIVIFLSFISSQADLSSDGGLTYQSVYSKFDPYKKNPNEGVPLKDQRIVKVYNWKDYQGRKIKWTGSVISVDARKPSQEFRDIMKKGGHKVGDLEVAIYVQIDSNERNSVVLLSASDLTASDSELNRMQQLKTGDSITFEGKLSMPPTAGSPMSVKEVKLL